MSRWMLFAVAAAAVVMAQYVDRGSQALRERQQEIARHQSFDDNLTTGSIRRNPSR